MTGVQTCALPISEGDTFYPEFVRTDWVETAREEHDGFAWVWLTRAD